MMRVKDVRSLLREKLINEEFVIDKTGVKTIELVGTSFIADEPTIFGTPNDDYIKREIAWYESQSLCVDDIPGNTPVIWKQVSSSTKHEVNSNYGYLIYSEQNGSQYENVLKDLRKNPFSRRAVMIYQRPSMHVDYNRDGMSDFICTNAVQYMLRQYGPHEDDLELQAVVQMRSNDAVFGYKNDSAWQRYVQNKLAKDLGNGVVPGHLFWNAGSLHVYERHFDLVR